MFSLRFLSTSDISYDAHDYPEECMVSVSRQQHLLLPVLFPNDQGLFVLWHF